MKVNAHIAFLFRLLLGSIFLVAGSAKIADPVRFLLTLRKFELFPDLLVPAMTLYLPWLELVLGICLLAGLLHRPAALLMAFLNLLFAGAILSVFLRGMEIDCGCFGLLADILKLPDAADMKAVIRNAIFAFLSFSIFRTEQAVFSLERYIQNKGFDSGTSSEPG